MKDSSCRALDDLEDFVEQAARLVSRGKPAWDADEFLRLAGEAVIHRIGEAVARLDRDDPELVAAHPEISWRAMKGMRNVVAHQYGSIDHQILWNALAISLPVEASRLRAIRPPE